MKELFLFLNLSFKLFREIFLRNTYNSKYFLKISLKLKKVQNERAIYSKIVPFRYM